MIFTLHLYREYALDQGDDGVCSLSDEALKTRFQVNIQDVDLLSAQRHLCPVEVGAQGFHLPVVLEIAEGDASPGSLQQGLVDEVPPLGRAWRSAWSR